MEEIKTETLSETTVKTELNTEAEAKPEAAVQPEAEAKPEVALQSEAEAKAEAKPKAEKKPAAKMQTGEEAAAELLAGPSDDVEYAIEIKDLCIRYKNLTKFSIKQGFFSLFKKKDGKQQDEFEAVSHVSFGVKKGEIFGIIGKNGSGKSTMLNAIAGIFAADEGSIDLHGHSISLLSIGVGFQREMTGRDNIFLSGMLLGFSEEEIKAKSEEIIEFSELGDFIDKPVKTYSSGMHSKLAFSITAILETDIMLIDEVLSVGDHRFKKKSYRKMKELISDANRTVIIVSHNNETLRGLCDRVMWMHDSKVKMIGPPKEIMDIYEEFMS